MKGPFSSHQVSLPHVTQSWLTTTQLYSHSEVVLERIMKKKEWKHGLVEPKRNIIDIKKKTETSINQLF
jgi:hypothetical protein